MRSWKKVAVSLLAVMSLSGLAGAVHAENRLERVMKAGKLVVCTEPYFAPNEFLDPGKTGQEAILGCDIDMAKYIAEKMGVELELVPLTFNAVLAGIAQGKYDLAISSLAYTPRRAQALEVSEPYKDSTSAGHGLMVRKEDAEKYKDFKDFDGKLVGYHTGTLQGELVEDQMPKAKKKVYDMIQNAVLALDAGKVDAVAVAVTNGTLFTQAYPNLTILPLRFYIEKKGTVIAAQKGEKEIIARVNEIIAEIRAKNLYAGWEKTALEKAKQLGLK